MQADLRITTGFVEPHFFAGFSGGPKLVTPGLAALDTVLTLHDASRIGHPNAIWGIIEGNPVHDDIRAVVEAVGDVHFALDVTLNREQADRPRLRRRAVADAPRRAARPRAGRRCRRCRRGSRSW